MATVDELLAEIERAGFDYQIRRKTGPGGAVYLGIDLCPAGALDAEGPRLHCFAEASDTARLAVAIADALAQMRAKAGKPRRGERA